MQPRDSFAGRDGSSSSTRLAVVVAGAAFAGCVGADPSTQPTQPDLSARDTYTQKAWPALGHCLGCHGAQPGVAWMAPGDADGAYATIFTFQPPVVNMDSPESSLMLTMGKHTGPALLAEDAPPILEWLQKEADERAVAPGATAVFGPQTASMTGMNTIDLGHGASLKFMADAFDGHLDFSQISIVTTTTKIHVTHPLFVSRPLKADPIIDSADHYEDLDDDIDANTTYPLTAATFLDFAATDPFTIHFYALEAP
ncbi:MAG: hypothetical protein QM831_37290 [Kofleriaceae bacterium]